MERERYRRQWVETRKKRKEREAGLGANPVQGGAGNLQTRLNVIPEEMQTGRDSPAQSDAP